MKTETDLADDFTLHALPDACVNVLLDQKNTTVAGVTALHTTHTTLNLGRSFHYVGIQFFPGVWRLSAEETVDHYVGESYEGALPLIEINEALVDLDLAAKVEILSQFVDTLLSNAVIGYNAATAAILINIGDIYTVSDMADVAGLSTRQLQRRLQRAQTFYETVLETKLSPMGDPNNTTVEMRAFDGLIVGRLAVLGTGSPRTSPATNWV